MIREGPAKLRTPALPGAMMFQLIIMPLFILRLGAMLSEMIRNLVSTSQLYRRNGRSSYRMGYPLT